MSQMGTQTLTDIFTAARDGNTLSHLEFRLWTYYRSWQVRSGKETGASVSDESAARDLGNDPRTVRRARRGLMEKGYLRQQLRGPKTALYWAVIPSDTDATPDEMIGQARPDKDIVGPDARTDVRPSAPPLVREYGSTTPLLRSGVSTHGRRDDELSEWLEEWWRVLGDFPLVQNPVTRRVLYDTYGPDALSTIWELPGGSAVPDGDRPRLLSCALLGYAAEGKERIIAAEFRGMLRRLVLDEASYTRPAAMPARRAGGPMFPEAVDPTLELTEEETTRI